MVETVQDNKKTTELHHCGSLSGFAFELPQMCKVIEKPKLILGFDVTHPNASDESAPTIAAVVANCDWSSEIKYVARVHAQIHRVSIIESLKEMTQAMKGWEVPEREIAF